MPARHPAVKSLPAALLSVAATLALSIALFLTACGGSSTANEFSWVSSAQGFAAITNVPGAPYSWTDSIGNLFDGQGSNATGVRTAQLNDRWEFRPATELWSWVSGSSTQNEIYVAAMPELNPSANTWTWVSGSTPGIVEASNVPGARCHSVSLIESGGNSWLACGDDDLQANAGINDLWRYGP